MEVIRLNKVVVRDARMQMREAVDFELLDTEHLAIVGDNGSGKSRLISIIRGGFPLLSGEVFYDFGRDDVRLYKNIALITFRSEYGGTDFFYQQRWNANEYEHTVLVGDVLGRVDCLWSFRDELYDRLEIKPLLSRYVVQLSSGELRRFHLTQVLLSQPRVLIIENPFVGLDVDVRQKFSKILDLVVSDGRVSLISVCSHLRDIPACTTHIYKVDRLKVGDKRPYIPQEQVAMRVKVSEREIALRSLPKAATDSPALVEFRSINLRYGERQLFSDFSWTVHAGERWLLSGANGSGKTTLLSLITADNPQAYALDISLFGRKRGTGESIWEIKRRIGFVSPEILRGYLLDLPAVRIVASGFFDTVGLYAKPSDDQLSKALAWMHRFEIGHLSSIPFTALSSGEQRLVLLARAFVKEPELLILDEPLHEIDERRSILVSQIVEEYCSQPGITLIYVSHYAEDFPHILTHSLRL